MVWEFPAVSQTRIEFWRKPQFTQSGMWWFTLFFGFFGIHHLYLRSPQTAVLFFILNFLTLGYLWAYDLVQLSSFGEFSGPSGLEALNKHGLSYPFGPLGLAQGMWKEPESLLPNGLLPQRGGAIAESEINKEAKEEEDKYGPPPQPIYFLLYTLTIMISPLAKAIAGDYNNSFSSIMNLTFVPLGFYFYIVGLVYDIFIIFTYPAHLFVEGAKRGIPFTWMGFDPKGHSPNITGKSEIDPCPPQESFITALMRWIIPIMKFFPPTMFHGTMFEKILLRWDDGKKAYEKREKILEDDPLAGLMSGISAFQRGDMKGVLHATGRVAKGIPGGAGVAKLVDSAEAIADKGKDALKAARSGNMKAALHATGDVAKVVPGGAGVAKLVDSAEAIADKGKDALKAAASGNMKGALHAAGDVAKIVPGGGAIAKLADSAEAIAGKGQDALKAAASGNMKGALDAAGDVAKIVPGGGAIAGTLAKAQGTLNKVEMLKGQGMAALQAVQKAKDQAASATKFLQKGGNQTQEPTFSLLDYTALGSIGAVIGGGLLLSVNRFRNVFTKSDDSPPKPRTV
jgi:hypothetical protein